RVVDVAVRVDVLGRGCEGHGEAAAHGSMPICHRMKANSSAVSRKDSNRPDLPPWPAPMLVFSRSSLSSVLSSRSLATHLAGSQYVTRGSLSPAVTSSGGEPCAGTLSYGAEERISSNAALSSIGLPHSGHSPGVSGSEASSIVASTSTNGT